MGFRVLKFGGTSVADATNMSRVLDIVVQEMEKGRIVLVGSAISKCTDGLDLAGKGDESQLDNLKKRHLDIVQRLFTGAERTAATEEVLRLFEEMMAAPRDEKVTYGELLSTRILARKLACDGVDTHWVDSRKLVVKDDLDESLRRIREAVSATDAAVVVAPGFICCDKCGKVCTLGRGGSDYSAALYAAALQAESLQKWTDVPGLMTANPKLVPAARTIPEMSYDAAWNMAENGAKVLYGPAVDPARRAGIDIEIRHTFDTDGAFTRISADPDVQPWVGIASKDGKLCLVGSSKADFTNIEHTIKDAILTVGIAPLEIHVEEESALVRVHVQENVEKQALQILHRTFFETPPRQQVDLFIAGFGAVGKELVSLVGSTASTVAERTGKTLRVVGLADSRSFRIDFGGISSLDGASEGDFVDEIVKLSPQGAVFVDCTDSKTIYLRYPDLFRAGLNVVSSNRRSFEVPYVEYAAMRAAALENGRFFRYETTVGAALPMLGALAVGANSCDKIESIEAVVSCTLNQILSSYGDGRSFASLVRAAQEEGLTERDPRLDLGGRDALRKLLILAREAGVPLEEEDVRIEPLIPDKLFDVSLEEFYKGLEALEPAFYLAHQKALDAGLRRRFVAFVEKDASCPLGYRAGICVKNVDEKHPAYHLQGTENAILFRSAFHPNPIVIQGPGEGALQAAASLLNDILR